MTEIHIVGTAHVSQKSIDEVRETVNAINPDVIAIELDAGRFATLKQQIREEKNGVEEKPPKAPDVKGILHGNFTLMLVQWLLGYVQRKIGMNVGVDPGSEMKEAIRLAEERNTRIVLIDRDINITLARFWKSMKFWEKVRLTWVLVSSVFEKDDETNEVDVEAINSLTHGDVMENALAEFHKFSPKGANVLIDERDAYLAHGVIELENSQYERAVVVCGAGHVPGITRYREHPESLPPLAELNAKPKKYPWARIIGILFIALFMVLLLAIGFSGATDKLIWAIIFWIFINGILAGIATIAIRGHPFS
ncbi:MAG TPA: TraB/GumN family protein, partial [Methanocorpusculum sp.]|nr:TraB/GumN family protein [Methanocorpusculum sp.]